MIVTEADLVACDTVAQCKIGGELQHISGDREVFELGAFTSGTKTAESPKHSISVCDITGTGAQDTAIAVEAYAHIKAAGLGSHIG